MPDKTYRLTNRIVRAMFWIIGLRFDVVGAENIPADGAAIIAANHTGYLDFTFVGLAASHRSRLVRFMAKRAIFDNPFAGPLMRRMGHIRVDRTCGAVAYREAERAVRAGEVVGIYPEATISRAWTLKPFKLGAATLAVRENVPLVPVIVWGGHRLWTVDGHRTLRRGIPVTILVGEAIHPAVGATVDQVNDRLQACLQDLLDEAQIGYPDRPKNTRDSWWLPRHLGGSAPAPDVAAELDAEAVNRSEQGAFA